MGATIVTFVLVLSGSLIGPMIRRGIERAARRAELSRDGLVDLHSLMTSLEDALPELAAISSPSSASDLVGTPSGFGIDGPTIELKEYLSCFENAELHRLFMLIFDNHKKLSGMSDEAGKAFEWLIQNPRRVGEPSRPRSQE